MRLKNVYAVEYSEPGNIEDYTDTIYFDNKVEADKEFGKELKGLKMDVEGNEDDVKVTLYHNGKFIKGYRTFDGKIEEM